MTRSTICAAACAMAILSLLLARPAWAGVYDDFNDGDAADGSPVTWIPLAWYPGTYDASTGDYRLIPPPGGAVDSFMASLNRDLSVADMSIRIQVRKETESPLFNEYVSIFARINPVDATRPPGDYTGYEIRLRQDGEFRISRQDAGTQNLLTSVFTPLDVTQQDVVLQFDLFGDSLSAWAWPADQPMPSAPLLSTEDFAYDAPGTIALASTDGDADSVGIFRWVHISPDHVIRDGDATDDGRIDIDDLNAVRNHFGATGAADGTLAGDTVPWDGQVNIDDLNAVRNNFGAGMAAVPEPGNLLAMVVGCAMLGSVNFRKRNCLESRT